MAVLYLACFFPKKVTSRGILPQNEFKFQVDYSSLSLQGQFVVGFSREPFFYYGDRQPGPPNVPVPRNQGLIAGLIKGNQWSPYLGGGGHSGGG